MNDTKAYQGIIIVRRKSDRWDFLTLIKTDAKMAAFTSGLLPPNRARVAAVFSCLPATVFNQN